MNINLSFPQFQKIQNAGYNLDHIYLLLQANQEADVKELCKESPKLEALYQGVLRKGLITEDGKITLTGKELITFTEQPGAEKIVKKKVTLPDFDLWWQAYPGTDTFTYQEKSFSGTRSLRTKKDDCKTKIISILQEGEYTIQDLIDALKFEVEQKKAASVKEKVNKLSYMQNSLTYLNQRTFESFIELIKTGAQSSAKEINMGGVDI